MQGLRLVPIRRPDRVLGMIARLKGEIWEALPGRIVVGAGGVGAGDKLDSGDKLGSGIAFSIYRASIS